MSTFTGSTLATTVTRAANTVSSFTAQTWDVYAPAPIQFIDFTCDIRIAGNYTLSIDGNVVASVSSVAAATNGVVFTPASPVTLAAGTHTFSLTQGSSITWYVKSNAEPSDAVTGTGSDYLGWGYWQETGATPNMVPGSIGFKIADGTLLSQVTPSGVTAGSLAAQTWSVTFSADVTLTGILKRLRDVDTTGYVLKIDGTTIATTVKPSATSTNLVNMLFMPASPLSITAGAHTFKIEPSASRRWSFRSGTGTSPTGSGSSMTTAWGTWSESSANQVDARLFFRIPDQTVSGGAVTVTASALAGTVSTASFIAGGVATVTATVAAGVVLAGALVSGGTATETDTAQAGTAFNATLVAGGTATETDTAQAGSVTGTGLVVGGTAVETDTALAGTLSLTVVGGQTGETSTVAAGSILQTIQGGQTAETITVIAGSNGGTSVTGGRATETDTALAGTVHLSYVLTDTSNDDDGVYIGDGYAEVFWDPGVVPIPVAFGPLPAEFYTVAKVIDTAPVGGAPATARQLSLPAAINRVMVNNVDLSFYGGAAAIVEGFRLIDPLLYGSGSVVLPAINPQFPCDLGDLYAYFVDADVRIQRVLDGEVIATDHKGFVSSIDVSGTQLRLDIGGQAAGSLSDLPITAPVYRRKQDVEHILCDLLRDARVRAKEHDGLSGVGLIKRGGADGLSIFNETLAVWAGASGQAITFTPNADGVYRKTQKPGDEDPIDFTCYPSDLVEISLAQDLMEQFTEVYAQGWTLTGELVTNIKTPGLTQGDAPPFPSADALGMGDTDADTTSGAGVTAIQEQLAIQNFVDLDDCDPGVFDLQLNVAVKAFQRFAGLNVTGEVGENTWDSLWDLDSIGYSLDDAREYPMAQDIRTVKWLRTANGSKRALNPDYDPHVRRKGIFFDAGGPFGKGQIRDFAESKLAPEGGVWSGTITLRSGVVAGEHNPSDAFTTADVMDRRDVLPNMRAWLPHFGGGIVVYVAGVDHSAETTQLLVSTVPQTTMEVWEALERRKEAKSNPGRAWSGHTRASQVRNDKGPQWDTTSGRIANKVALVAGWNEVKVPAGQAGVVKRIRVQLEDAAEFACLLTQASVSVEALNTNTATATPLVDPRPSSRPWNEREAIVEWLDARGKLDAWGTPAQPCGYDPSRKNDELGATAQAMTGLFVEDAGFNYATGPEPVLYLYVWVGTENALLPGRVLRNQRTTDF